ncbi:hypothetical protein [Fodinicurvata fenggangensis]|uniref:hypothetical protein n=1 Tax=Fodinicurvata fenggangensis TaxID=1121830 RepID=UPI000479AA34|nr:hypothetical protein [Fodinicurvata fenggangensis]
MQVFGNSGALLIETDERGVGLAIREGEHFRFTALDPRYDNLDGQLFGSPEEVERAIQRQGADSQKNNGQRSPAHAA